MGLSTFVGLLAKVNEPSEVLRRLGAGHRMRGSYSP